MSDLYLVLRRRLTEVTDWLEIGSDVMLKARKSKGLSAETAARLLHVSSKTYDRREKDGRWPRHDIEQLADVLGLEIERPTRTRVTVGEPPADDPWRTDVLLRMDRLEDVLERLLQRFPDAEADAR